jgi:hypothetical protein
MFSKWYWGTRTPPRKRTIVKDGFGFWGCSLKKYIDILKERRADPERMKRGTMGKKELGSLASFFLQSEFVDKMGCNAIAILGDEKSFKQLPFVKKVGFRKLPHLRRTAGKPLVSFHEYFKNDLAYAKKLVEEYCAPDFERFGFQLR